MPETDTELEFDFGDPTLNDPNYEQNIGADDVTPTDAPADTGTQKPTPADSVTQQPATDAQQPDAGAGGAGDKQGQQPTAPVGGTRSDDKGNLIDAAGNIIAAAGAERRHYERVQQQARYIKTLERDLETARGGASMTGVLNGVPSKLGLDARETELGLQVIASFKKDPVATARWALQETMQMGYNLAQIVGASADGQPLSGSLDLNAVKAMISEAVAPLVGDRQASQREQQATQDAEREYQAFVAKHEHAAIHEDTIVNMLKGDKSLTPETAYWQLVAYCARNGYEFSQPLRAQVLARQQGQRGAPAAAPNGNAQPPSAQRPMPMPNGSAPTADMQQSDGMAAPDASWDSIVQQSLRDAGFH